MREAGGVLLAVCQSIPINLPELICNFLLRRNGSLRGFPGSSPGKESTCNAEDPGSIPGSERSPGEGIGYPLQYSWASLVALMFKESTCNVGDLSSVPGLGRSPEGGHGNPLQCSCLENPHGQRSLADYIQSMGSQRVGQD